MADIADFLMGLLGRSRGVASTEPLYVKPIGGYATEEVSLPLAPEAGRIEGVPAQAQDPFALAQELERRRRLMAEGAQPYAETFQNVPLGQVLGR